MLSRPDARVDRDVTIIDLLADDDGGRPSRSNPWAAQQQPASAAVCGLLPAGQAMDGIDCASYFSLLANILNEDRCLP